jgi:DNA-binding response OmpR family regulator
MRCCTLAGAKLHGPPPSGGMTDDAATILVVEDDPATRTFLADNLTADGYEVLACDCARDALSLLEAKTPDLLLLDLGLPDLSGLEVLRRVREADGVTSRMDPGTPVLLLTGRAGEIDRVRGFERGADDYLGKPFGYAELRARIHAVLRRTRARRSLGRIRAGALEIDPVSHRVLLRGEPVELSAKEFALLRVLAVEPARVWSKEDLLRTVWGFRSMGRTRTVDSHACRLRRKLGVHGDRYIVNVWGVGYRLLDPVVMEQAA